MENKLICPNCETENPTNYIKCLKCNIKLKEDEYYNVDKEKFTEIFSHENLKKLEEIELTADTYNTITTRILDIGAINIYAIPPNLTIENLSNVIRTYINLEFSDDIEYNSSYSIDKISINNKLSDEIKTKVALKEFSKYLRFQLYKQSINTLLNLDLIFLLH